jgi:large subunit ribosomal protein L30
MSAAKKKLKVTLVRSTIQALPKHKATVLGLGLRRIRHSVLLDDNACIRGMIHRVSHLLLVEEAH